LLFTHEEKDVEELHMERFRQRYGIALTKKKLQEIILMLMALEAVFAFSYLGYIELPAISTTTLHILVIVAAWSGTKVGTLSISSGCAFAGDHPDFSVEQLTQAADLSMYARKQEYYRAKKLSSGTPVSSGNGVRP
jgi:GGDEF domain-containing protein